MFEQSPRPNKRARLSPSPTMSTAAAADDMDDIYGTPSANNTPAIQSSSATDYVDAKQLPHTHSATAGIPGLGMFPPATPLHDTAPHQLLQSQSDQPQPAAESLNTTETAPHTSQTQQPSSDDQLLQASAGAPAEQPASAPVEQTPAAAQFTPRDAASALFDALGNNDDMNKNLPDPPTNESVPTTVSAAPSKSTKAPVDPEFLEAAEAQKTNKDAEWQLDSSDAESSSDDSSSDDSSSDQDDSDEEGYELLDPATAARMLMEEGAMDDDEGGNKASTQAQLRTKNEQPEEIIPKPDVTVTPDMKVTVLGAVQHIVDTLILIKAFTSGEYQVLESGSVLCLEDRQVIGAVQDTLGKVEEPLYSVAFTRPSDITDLGITTGTEIFYVDAHSTYVFTQPLKNMKGTDASNLHDEEVAEEEMEFSDDEAEAAYKRAKKEAKKGARAAHNQTNQPNQPPAAKPYTGGAINYDDETENDEMYTPLARPDNLQELMVNGAPPARRQFPDRGRGRGRGRGDRGRGDRGRGGRGGRGAADNANQRKGPSNSYPDSHNAHTPAYTQQTLPQKPAVPQQMPQMQQQMWPQGQPQTNAPFAFPQFSQQQFPPPPPPPQVQSPFPNVPFAWPPNPQFFNQIQQQQQTFNQGQQQQPFRFPSAPSTPGGSIPAGAFVNPAFFQQQQQQQHQAPMAPAANAQPNAPTPEQIQAAADIWRRLQQQQQ